jgi:acetolactate decarboxylase
VVLVVAVCFAGLYEAGYLQLTPTGDGRETVFQVAEFNWFALGNYAGTVTYGELASHGDFGIGTLDGLNGEMVAVDGVFYQIPSSGVARVIGSSETAPFAEVTFFDADQSFQVSDALNYSQMTAYIASQFPSDNAIYAVKIHGTFSYVKARSPPVQSVPYPNLTMALVNQSYFTFNNVEATVVGFWFPSYMEGINVAGFHLHFLTADKTAGGHVLECTVQNVTVELDQTKNFEMTLP